MKLANVLVASLLVAGFASANPHAKPAHPETTPAAATTPAVVPPPTEGQEHAADAHKDAAAPVKKHAKKNQKVEETTK